MWSASLKTAFHLDCPQDMALAYSTPYPSMMDVDYDQTSFDDARFALARINGAIRLVQVSLATPTSALTTVDVKIFRHEFIHIFRYLECKTLHPVDVHIIELIDDQNKTYDEDADTVFLAKDVMARISKLTSRHSLPSRPGVPTLKLAPRLRRR
ncbi:hypothetical protein FB45DRAFT_907516 [Roridomyces roridus]|uniref:Uncharacterized protein n=1 Tax=Roridomyces roridus TaxID=1738132 RepID=A0AAD7C1X9_9AGAR|nr:hypothetical protein FB45DRAFT_907516 [Roridomyces roridus]